MSWQSTLQSRRRTWQHGHAPPERVRCYAFPFKDVRDVSAEFPVSPSGKPTGQPHKPEGISPVSPGSQSGKPSAFEIATGASAALAFDDALISSTHIISTIDQDRAGDVMIPEGCFTGNYEKNPVVFFGHQMLPFPIGLSKQLLGERRLGPLQINIIPGQRIEATCFYSHVRPEALDIYAMVKEGTLGMTSIGFNPLTRPMPVDPGRGSIYGGFRFDKWELLEWSIVGIPCNPHCEQIRSYLSVGKVKHGSGRSLSRMPAFRKSLEMLAAPVKSWSNGWGCGQPRDSHGNMTLR